MLMENNLNKIEMFLHEFPQLYIEKLLSYDKCSIFLEDLWIKLHYENEGFESDDAFDILQSKLYEYIINLFWIAVNNNTDDIKILQFLTKVNINKIVYKHISRCAGKLHGLYPIVQTESTEWRYIIAKSDQLEWE